MSLSFRYLPQLLASMPKPEPSIVGWIQIAAMDKVLAVQIFQIQCFLKLWNSKRAHFLPIILDANQLNKIWFYNSTTFKIKTIFISFQVLSNSLHSYIYIYILHTQNFPRIFHRVSPQTLGLFQNGNPPKWFPPPRDDWIPHAARPMRRAWLASARVASGSGELRPHARNATNGGGVGLNAGFFTQTNTGRVSQIVHLCAF